MKIEFKNQNLIYVAFKLLSSHKRHLVIIILCMLISSGVSLLCPILRQMIIDNGILKSDIRLIVFIILIILALSLLSHFLMIVQSLYSTHMSQLVQYSLYKKAFRKVLKINLSYFEENNFFRILENIKYDISMIVSLVDDSMIMIISQVLQICGGLIGLTAISWKLSILLVITIPFKILINNFYKKKKKIIYEDIMKNLDAFNSWISDSLNNIEIIHLWNLHIKANKQFIKFQRILIRAKLAGIKTDQTYNAIDGIIDLLGNSLAYVLGSLLILSGEITIGAFFTFLTYSSFVINPLSLFIHIGYQFAGVKPALKRYISFMEQKEYIVLNGRNNLKIPNQIIFEKVTFYYNDTKILDNISFTINKGEKIALYGKNGSGKTTILRLLLRLIEPSNGVIKMDNTSIQEFDTIPYKSMFTTVLQSNGLFNDTIANNIDPSGKFSKSQLYSILNEMHLESFMIDLPNGINTIIGAKGSKISSGQHQKIMAIRALIKNAHILILDEATANYDLESIKLFNEIIDNSIRYDYIFVVTHQQEILSKMDRICVLHNGKVVKFLSGKEYKSEGLIL